MPAFFVTAAGTEIGKTYVTAALVRRLRERGERVAAYKPVASGFDASTQAESDAAALLAALGRPATLEEIARISPWRFAAPLSPDMAAAREGRAIPLEELVAWSGERIGEAPHDAWTFVEGVGGALVPLDATRTVGDWFAALGAPALVVGGSYLGAISHLLTAHEALARRGRVAAIVVNETPGATVALAETAATIARFVDLPVIALPRDAEREPETIDALLRALTG